MILAEAGEVVGRPMFAESEESMRAHEGKLRAVIVTTTHQIDELLKVRSLYNHEHSTLLARLQSLDQSSITEPALPSTAGTSSQLNATVGTTGNSANNLAGSSRTELDPVMEDDESSADK